MFFDKTSIVISKNLRSIFVARNKNLRIQKNRKLFFEKTNFKIQIRKIVCRKTCSENKNRKTEIQYTNTKPGININNQKAQPTLNF